MTDEQKRAVPICEHIKTNNERCGSPALRGFHFCYYHARSRSAAGRHRKINIKAGALQSNRSIEMVLAQVTQAVSDDEISPAKGNTLGRLLRLAQNVVSAAGALRKGHHSGPPSANSLLGDIGTKHLRSISNSAQRPSSGATEEDTKTAAS